MTRRSPIFVLLATVLSSCGAWSVQQDINIKSFKQLGHINHLHPAQMGFFNTILISGAAVLVLLIVLLFGRYYSKQRHNKQLASKQQEINEKNTVLKELVTDKDGLLKQKDWLVNEIHHRVKNNLQMVISLLNVQSEFLHNPSALDAIRESRERIQAIALIHQKLYNPDKATRINMQSYITELIDCIKTGVINAKRISFHANIADAWLEISYSVPLGLILNEAIINSIKYAYAENETGPVFVSLQYTARQQLQLKIADNGKGLPPGMEIHHFNTLGMQLMKLFAEQIDAMLSFNNNNGLEIVVTFNVPEDTGDKVKGKLNA